MDAKNMYEGRAGEKKSGDVGERDWEGEERERRGRPYCSEGEKKSRFGE